MRVAIGSDHHGVDLRAAITKELESAGHEVIDVGAEGGDPVDYPDIAAQVGQRVAAAEADRGMLICASGIGMSIAANKIGDVRAAVCHNANSAEMSRRHNDANVLCLADKLDGATNLEIVKIWMETEFEGGRHQRRVDKISALEK